MLTPHYITSAQLKAIKTLVGKLGLSAAEENAIYQSQGVEHASDLIEAAAGKIITALSNEAKKRGIVHTPKKFYGKGQRGSQQHITPLQAERIGMLKEFLNWSDAGLTSFITKQCGKVAAVQMLMNYEATKVVTGMQRVLAWRLYTQWNAASDTPRPSGTPLKGETSDIYKNLNDLSNKKLKELYEREKNNKSSRCGNA